MGADILINGKTAIITGRAFCNIEDVHRLETMVLVAGEFSVESFHCPD